MQEDKEITEILLELAEEENRQLRYENNMLKRLLKEQDYNFREMNEQINALINIENRLN